MSGSEHHHDFSAAGPVPAGGAGEDLTGEELEEEIEGRQMTKARTELRVLLVEDSKEVATMLQRHLESCGYFVCSRNVQTAGEMSAALEEQAWDVVLSDHHMPEFDAIGALNLLKRLRPDIPFIIVSGTINEEFAAEIMREGARDFVTKSNLARLQPVIEREMSEARRRLGTTNLETELGVVNRRLKETLALLAKTQGQLVQTERIKALGQMASGVAHDINNALTKMMGIVEMAEAEAKGESHPLQQLKTTVMDAAKIVRRLRLFYRPVDPVEDADPLDLNMAIREVADLTKSKWKTQSAAEGRSISMELKLAEIPPIAGQKGEMREALACMIFNACDAMPTGGAITISTFVDNGKVVATVTDNGAGMSEKTRQRCLEPYFTTKGKARTGMGLALVDAMVRSYGGEIEVGSATGAGTTMTMRWTEYEQHRSEGAPPPAKAPVSLEGTMRILVADDDLAVSILISQFLRLDGHEVDIVKDGQSALERFDPEKHQAVISDRAMPVMDGDHLAAAIKARSPKTPVIMASGFVDAVAGEEDGPTGVDSLLQKPITREDLREALVRAKLAVDDSGARVEESAAMAEPDRVSSERSKTEKLA